MARDLDLVVKGRVSTPLAFEEWNTQTIRSRRRCRDVCSNGYNTEREPSKACMTDRARDATSPVTESRTRRSQRRSRTCTPREAVERRWPETAGL